MWFAYDTVSHPSGVWICSQWLQTIQVDFEAGVRVDVDTSSSPGDVKLATVGSYIYAFQGSLETAFWRYDIGDDSWTSMANAPDSVAGGGALAFRGIQYLDSGTIASQVLDTGTAGTTWEELSWNETLESGADITFEVRASDTQFLKDDATPSWISVGGTSPVTAGLLSGRYMQWRAALTTSDTSKTPTLHEVTIRYY